MWNLTRHDLSATKGAGGERFAAVVDRLIVAEGWLHGVPKSEIATQLRTHVPDGGVDT